MTKQLDDSVHIGVPIPAAREIYKDINPICCRAHNSLCSDTFWMANNILDSKWSMECVSGLIGNQQPAS
jgi:hypothetical protein